MTKLYLGLSIAALFIIGCDISNINYSPKDPVPVKDVQVISAMSNDFGWNLFQETAKGVTEENVLVSPISVQTALSMAVNGANGETLDEMLEVLSCPGCVVADLNKQTALLRVMMEEQSGHPRLISANGFFYDPNRASILESFVQTLTADYRAVFQTHDFNKPVTVDNINNWVKENTDGKIDKIIEEIVNTDLAFLINALHFKASWSIGFSPELTYSGLFTTAAQAGVPVDYVTADRNFSTARRSSFIMVDIPFKDSTYSLSLVQPAGSIAAQSDWVLSLKSSELRDMWAGLSYDRAIVSFPKLDIAYDIELKEPLERMGMKKAFLPGEADFSKLGHALIGDGIYITKVSHKSVLKVDEKGAEGAAVTSIGFGTTSAPPEFRFNKPFVIVLRHTSTNAILFAGLINDPS